MTIDPRKFIEELHQAKQKHDDGLVARILETVTHTAFKTASVIHELLQNADDQALQDNATVTFALLKDELIVYHTGKEFDQEDVRRLCDYGNYEQNRKSHDADKTGYKNLGFKAVFKIASRVDIWSNEWHFHFDETKWPRKDGEQPHPWQISPLWTEEKDLSEAAQKIVKEAKRTSFIFKLRKSEYEAVSEVLQKLAATPESILFLKKIRHLLIETPEKTYTIENRGEFVCVNSNVVSRWIHVKRQIPIDEAEAKTFLKDAAEAACPKWLRIATETTLSFAYLLSDKGLIQVNSASLFCTLPTAERTGHPFLVNGSFLLDPAREKLLDNPWNRFLIRQIASHHFQHIQFWLTSKTFTALYVMAPEGISLNEERLQTAFRKSMSDLIATQPFVPTQQGEQLLRLGECYVDTTGFYQRLYRVRPQLSAGQPLVHPELDLNYFMGRFPGVKKLGLQEVIAKLPQLMTTHRTVETCALLLDILTETFTSRQDLEALKAPSFVLTHKLELVSLGMRPHFFPNFAIPDKLPFTILHPQLHSPEKVAWLKTFGLEQLSPQAIVDAYKFKLNDESLREKSSNIQIIRLFFTFFKDNLIKEEAFEALRGILLISKADTVCCSLSLSLPASYAPAFNLEPHIPQFPAFFICEEYRHFGEEIETWRRFFYKLGVRESCDFFHLQNVAQLRSVGTSYMEEYLKSIPKATKTAGRDLNQDTISPFCGFPYMEAIGKSPKFSDFFWKQLIQREAQILTTYSTTTYYGRACRPPEEKAEPYLQYVFRTQKLIPDERGVLHPAHQLYAPSLKGVTTSTAALSVRLSPQLEAFLGFKMTLDPTDCHKILLQLQKKFAHEAYMIVMRHLLENIRRGALFPTSLQWEFQDSQNSWKKTHALKLWAVPQSQVPHNVPGWIKQLFSSDKDLEDFCAFFRIPKETQFQNETLLKSAEAATDLRDFIYEKIPEIAFYVARHQSFSRSNREYITMLTEPLAHLKFFCIPEKYDTEAQGPVFNLLDDCLYYYEDWKDQKKPLAKVLARFLKLEKNEGDAVKTALQWGKPYKNRESMKKIEELTSELTAQYTHIEKAPPEPSRDKTPPPDTKRASEETLKVAAPTTPSTDDELPSDSPYKEPLKVVRRRQLVRSNAETSSEEEPLKATPKSWSPKISATEVTHMPIQKALTKPSMTPQAASPATTPTQKKDPTPQKSEKVNLAKLIEKKRKGQWAEQHVLNKLIEKYLKDYKGTQVESLGNGQRKIRFASEDTSIDFLWYNDPERRPTEEKDDPLWDSGQHYDIEVTWTAAGKELKKRFVEAKGTAKPHVHFFLQAMEWKTLLASPDQYRIYAVTKIGTESSAITVYKNNELMEAIKTRNLLPIKGATEFGKF